MRSGGEGSTFQMSVAFLRRHFPARGGDGAGPLLHHGTPAHLLVGFFTVLRTHGRHLPAIGIVAVKSNAESPPVLGRANKDGRKMVLPSRTMPI